VEGVSPRIHLVYPHGPGIAAPHVIGRRLGEHLSARHDVVLHDWDASHAITPSPGDVLLGHPHPSPGTVFRRSFRRPGWSRRIVMSPFNGDPRQVGFLDPFVRRANGYLAITGRWWALAVSSTSMAHWAPHMLQLDLAIDRSDFPLVKQGFAPPGRRRFLYLGHSGWQKNVGYLSQIAQACPEWEFGWLGGGSPGDIPGVRHLGYRDTSLPETRRLVATYDFMITVGRADANPMSVLEAMSWGLIPVCTPQSGYVGEEGVANVPLDDVPAVVRILKAWQGAPVADLDRAQRANEERLAQHFTWERFGDQVEAALTADLPPTAPVSRRRIASLAAIAATSPSGPFGAAARRFRSAARRLARLPHTSA